MEVNDNSQANDFKNKGNQAFRQKEWDKAISFFTKAIELDTTNSVFYSNRSAAYIQLALFNKALEDANKTIELKPDWSKGYQRQGMALFCMSRYTLAQRAYEQGLKLEPSPELENGLQRAKMALKIDQVIRKGVWPKVPIFYFSGSSNPIDWKSVKTACDVFINRNCTGLWAVSSASEMGQLTSEECEEFSRKIVSYCEERKVPVISGVKPQATLELLAQEIIMFTFSVIFFRTDCVRTFLRKNVQGFQKMYSTGPTAVIVDLSSLGKTSDSDSTLVANLKRVTDITRDIPLGLRDSKQRNFSPDLLQGILDLNKIYFIIDHSGSRGTLDNIFRVVGDLTGCFRVFNGNATSLLPTLQKGGSGSAGDGAAFMTNIYAWVCNNYQSDAPLAANLSSFLSLAEPVIDVVYPLNLKVFLRLREPQLQDVTAVTRTELSTQQAEENLLRLTHLHDAAHLVEAAISDKKGKRKDYSVLL